jgi:amino acid transporter
MASRLLYGMGHRGWLPLWFSRIYAPTRTPVNSTLVIASLILTFAVLLPIIQLAEMTSLMILIVFALINLALIKVKQRQPHPASGRVFSIWIPRLGLVTAVAFLLLNLASKILGVAG